MATPLDPIAQVARCCAFCYKVEKEEIKLKSCGKCHHRTYCSRSCQRNDWSIGAHKFWCGKAAERGIDIEVKLSEGKGYGLFALRNFVKRQKIIVERPVLTAPHLATPANMQQLELQINQCSPAIKESILALGPTSNQTGFQEKFLNNRMKISSKIAKEQPQSGLCLTLARVNHACIGNAAHFTDVHHDALVEVLVATRDIQEGEEITFSYSQTLNKSKQERSNSLLRDYGFVCDCHICRDPTLSSQLDQTLLLDQQIATFASQQKSDQAIAAANQLMQLQTSLQLHDTYLARTHFDLFQLYVTKKDTLPLAMEHLQNARHYALAFFGYPQHDECRQYQYYLESPEKHPSYLCREPKPRPPA